MANYWTIQGIDIRGSVNLDGSTGIKLRDVHAESISADNANNLEITKTRVDGSIDANMATDSPTIQQNISDNIVGGSISADIHVGDTISWLSLESLSIGIGLSFLLIAIGVNAWFWRTYTFPIQQVLEKRNKEKEANKKGAASRGWTTIVLERHNNAIDKKYADELEVLQENKRLFLDQISLFLGFLKLPK